MDGSRANIQGRSLPSGEFGPERHGERRLGQAAVNLAFASVIQGRCKVRRCSTWMLSEVFLPDIISAVRGRTWKYGDVWRRTCERGQELTRSKHLPCRAQISLPHISTSEFAMNVICNARAEMFILNLAFLHFEIGQKDDAPFGSYLQHVYDRLLIECSGKTQVGKS